MGGRTDRWPKAKLRAGGIAREVRAQTGVCMYLERVQYIPNKDPTGSFDRRPSVCRVFSRAP